MYLHPHTQVVHFLFESIYSGSQIDEVQQQQSANNSQGLVVHLSYSRTAIAGVIISLFEVDEMKGERE